MDKQIRANYIKSGQIHHEVTELIKKKIKPGMKLLEIADFVEARIQEKGAGLAFPVNTSLNDVAAHYVAQANDSKTVEAGDLLKVDIGVEVEGCVADGAFTYCSEPSPLAEAAEAAIAAAVAVIRPGVTVGEVSAEIARTVADRGLGLIINLTGHGVDVGQFHAHPTVPNTATGSPVVLEKGMVIAIEPFTAAFNGVVKETTPVEIYRFLQPRAVRLPEARMLQEHIAEAHEFYPFAKRWLPGSPVKNSMAIRQLEQVMCLESYPPLRETRGQLIAQAEHTIIVEDKPVVITKGSA